VAPTLVLFDIDGTLVRRTGPQHRQALVDAVREVTGLESTTDGIPVHGMLDPDILTLMLRAAGVADSRTGDLLPLLYREAEASYLAHSSDLSASCCPGVPSLLEDLSTRGIPLALVTGNLTRIGWRKLERAGLGAHFRFGAFGEMAATRGLLAKLAIEKARSEGMIGPKTRISLIGDAPQDVLAAKENGIQSIAVRTGITPPGDLEACEPDYLLDDLTGLDKAIL
jgi:phosphoglycolate phosphatase-like HAD superfamily hydrolase